MYISDPAGGEIKIAFESKGIKVSTWIQTV